MRVLSEVTVMLASCVLALCRNMKGMEYVLLHVMEPILYVIRKNFRQGPDKCEPFEWFTMQC